jgi:hypothetical protein
MSKSQAVDAQENSLRSRSPIPSWLLLTLGFLSTTAAAVSLLLFLGAAAVAFYLGKPPSYSQTKVWLLCSAVFGFLAGVAFYRDQLNSHEDDSPILLFTRSTLFVCGGVIIELILFVFIEQFRRP